jgi:hypothetical protein
MNDFQKVGGVAALIQAALLVGAIGLALAAFPAIGLSVNDLASGNGKFLEASGKYPAIFASLDFILVGGAVVILIVALVLHERWRNKSLRLANLVVASALALATLRITTGLTMFIGTARIVDLYGTDHAQALTAYASFSGVTAGMEEGSRFAAGCFLILAGWAALHARDLPRPLAYLAIVVGIDQLLEVFVRPLAPVFGLVAGIGLIIWSLWLGVVLLRSRSMVPSDSRQSAGSRPETVADLP